MGLLQRLGNWRLDDGVSDNATAASYLLGGTPDVVQVSNLPADVAAAFGLGISERVDRASAMTIPAVRRARQVIAGSIGACPLVAHRTNPDGSVQDVTADRPVLVQPDPNTTLQYVLTWTVDDLLFYGIAWWLVKEKDLQGYPKQVERLALSRVSVQPDGVYVDGVRRFDDELIRFDGPDEGVLRYGGPVLTTTQLLDAAARKFARLDVPLGVLKLQEGATELSTAPGSCGIEGDDRSQVDLLLDMWEDARRRRTTAYLNRAVDYETKQFDAAQMQLVEGRQQQRVDVANLMNVAPKYVNAPSATGMTYTNQEAERRDLVDTSLAGFIVALQQRLSMGDVTPRGTTVRVDVTQLLRGDTKTALESAKLAVELQAMTADEVRTDVLGRTPLNPGASA